MKTGPSCLLFGVRHFVGDPPSSAGKQDMDGERPLACSFLVSHLPAEGGGEGGGRNRVLRRRRTTNLFARGKGEKRDRWKNDFFFDVDFDDFAPSLSFFCPFFFRVVGIFPLSFNFFVWVVFFAVQENYLLAQTRREASLQHAILVRSAGDAVSQTFSTVHFAKCVGPLLPVMPF